MNRHRLAQKATPALALSVVLLAGLTACGGGSTPATSVTPDAATAATAQSATLDSATVAALAANEVQPTYHMAPVLLDEPGQADVGGTNASARFAPKRIEIDGDLANIDTRNLSRDVLKQRLADLNRMRVASASTGTAPQAQAIIGAVHTPAQIRAAYGLSDLPAAGTTPNAAQAAALGAGQTIYIVDAYHDATALSDLNAFSAKFGLPTCTNVTIATNATLPLATPPSACTFSQVNGTTGPTMSATVPAYNATWAPESKLDVQWAHAIAPLARIVLIEMPNSLSTSILGANELAGKMGPGVVSMSFGSAEAAWAPSIDSEFTGTGMTYVAAAGDSGTQVLWPAVSPHVIAVGGTSLNWTGTGTRYEAAWNKTGGGLSAYEPLPAWQSGVKPAGGSALVRRAVPDVAFNANPATGEYVALTLPGAATVWSDYGGTSIAAPQWAGVVAVANAMRKAAALPVLGDFHALLYQSIGAVPGTYASAMGDVVDGTNGTCATCIAGAGFDQTTGWGSPNSSQLMQVLGGGATPQATTPAAPTLSAGSYAAKAGTAFSQALAATAPSGTTLSYAVSGAPSGLSVTTAGALSWAAPVAGSYSFTATATTSAGKSASATIALKVIPATNPTFSSTGKFTGKAGTAFAGTLAATNPNTGTLTFAVSGAPSGLVASSTGALSWAAPVAGSYTFTATVKDSYGYTSSQTQTLTIAAAAAAAPTAAAPTLASATYTAKAGATFSAQMAGQNAAGGTLTYTMSGAPSAVKLTSGGFLYWVGATAGTYKFTVTVHNAAGAAGNGTITLVIS